MNVRAKKKKIEGDGQNVLNTINTVLIILHGKFRESAQLIISRIFRENTKVFAATLIPV